MGYLLPLLQVWLPKIVPRVTEGLGRKGGCGQGRKGRRREGGRKGGREGEYETVEVVKR
jgi:hypothetical protein